MNIFKWLASKAGKMPVTIAQAAGITAVVGAAGFAAMSYLNTPTDNNTSFIPPSAYEQQGDVVYVSQGGGAGGYSGYAANGEVASSFHARQSDSIRLANERYERQQRAQALADTDVQPAYAQEEMQMPKAYQMGAGDVGLGMGTNADKQLNSSLDMLSNLQKEIPGLGAAVSNAQAQASAAQGSAPGANGQAAKFTKASADYTRVAGGRSSGSGSGGSGGSNTFAIQDSGKNVSGKDATAALAQVGNAMADAQAAMKQMQEGTRMRSSRASFGRDGFGEDKDVLGQGSRMGYRNAKSELEYLRKRSAEIDKNKTNSANEGGRPFLASAKISGGLTVDGDNVTTGTGSTSGDLLSSSTDRQMRGLSNWAGGVESSLENRTKDRHDLRKWMWWALPLAMVMIPVIGALATLARALALTFWGAWAAPIVKALAYALAVVTLYPIVRLIISGVSYMTKYGADGSSIFATALGGILTAGVGLALWSTTFGIFCFKLPILVWGAGIVAGFGGSTLFQFLSKKGEGISSKDLDDNATEGSLEERADNLKGGNR